MLGRLGFFIYVERVEMLPFEYGERNQTQETPVQFGSRMRKIKGTLRRWGTPRMNEIQRRNGEGAPTKIEKKKI